MTAPTIQICVRRTIDWEDLAVVEANLIPSLRPKYEMWNRTFRMPYHLFRHRVKRIAALNLSRMKEAAIRPFEEVEPGSMLVPVDDDDWFSPDLAAHLKAAYDPAMRGYVWNRHTLKPHPVTNPFRWAWRKMRGLEPEPDPIRFTCSTNNYAYRVGDGWGENILGHCKASRRFDSDPRLIKRLRHKLSIQNKNLSSQTALAWNKPAISRARLMRRFRRYKKLYAAVRLSDELAWAEPYVRMMAELMEELEPV